MNTAERIAALKNHNRAAGFTSVYTREDGTKNEVHWATAAQKAYNDAKHEMIAAYPNRDAPVEVTQRVVELKRAAR